MKKLYTLACLLGLSTLSFAQDTTGMIAHWNMNGTPNDVTGHGHNGTAVNVTPALGKDGVMGHAYYFNGSNSVITVPYSPAFNLSNYSICATVKVQGFYTGTCHANTILQRGKSGPGVGTYSLYFTDLASGTDCYTADTTQEDFLTGMGSTAVSSITDFYYSPVIAEDTWYSVVGTFNDTAFKVYVNGTLKSTVAIISPGMAIPTSTDSISIGLDIYEAALSYPYPLNGVIDDIRFYDRALSSVEIDSYTTSTLAVNTVTKPESEITIYPNPAQNGLQIQTNRPANGQMDIVISDLVGRELIHTTLSNTSEHINIEGLTTGMYFINIYCDGQSIAKKFIKQ